MVGHSVVRELAYGQLLSSEFGAHRAESSLCGSKIDSPPAQHHLVVFGETPRAGAQTQLRLALDPALENSSGDYYSYSLRFPLLT
ncbi:hypothetical protein ACLKA6_009922 [Drosophila palustris]